MKSDRFNLIVLIYALWIAGTSALFFAAVETTGYTFTSIGLVIMWIMGIFLLIQYVNITNRNLLVFLQSFRFHDNTIEFNKIKKFPFRPVYDEFNRIIHEFKLLKQEKETEHQYYEHVVKHVNTALIAWDENEKIRILNDKAQKAFKTPFISTLSGLKFIVPDLPDILRNLEPGKKQLYRLNIRNQQIPLSISFSRFIQDQTIINLASIEDIGDELEENESEAWIKLMKLINHEIVNSLSPIKLVSSGLGKKLETNSENITDLETSNELKDGLKAIYNRSNGLLRFIEDFRTISEIARPDIREESVDELFASLVHLVRNSLVPPDVNISFTVEPEKLRIHGDRKLIEQVLINLIKNSVYSLKDIQEPGIRLTGFIKDDRTILGISDNGCGIPFNIRDFIFMPFFTTKKEGSGIGLSFSRQIMKLHKGNIQVISEEGAGTTVFLIF